MMTSHEAAAATARAPGLPMPRRPISSFWLLCRDRYGGLRWHFCARLSGEVWSLCTDVHLPPGCAHPGGQVEAVLDASRRPPTDSPHLQCTSCVLLADAEMERAVAEGRAPVFRPCRLPQPGSRGCDGRG